MAIVAANAGLYLLGAAWLLSMMNGVIVQVIAAGIIAGLGFDGFCAIRELMRRAGSGSEPE